MVGYHLTAQRSNNLNSIKMKKSSKKFVSSDFYCNFAASKKAQLSQQHCFLRFVGAENSLMIVSLAKRQNVC